jgi:hypothetical protein
VPPQAVDQESGSLIGAGGFIDAFELDLIRRYLLGHRVRSRGLSDACLRQCMAFMHRDVFGLAALDFILRIIFARVVSVSLVINVLCMHFDDRAADMASLGVPRHLIAHFEPFRHHKPAITV